MRNRKAKQQKTPPSPLNGKKKDYKVAPSPPKPTYTMEGKWPTWLMAFIAFIIPFTIYMRTLNVDMVGGDWGELVVSQYQFSVPHPPGYPTFMALGYLWINFLPIPGSPAYRANVLSAFTSSLASVAMFFAIRELLTAGRDKRPSRAVLVASVFGAIFFALSPIVWMYSIHAEVFALNNLFVAIVFYLTFRYQRTLELKTAYWGAFACGLALTNQHTSVVFEAVIVPWVLWIGRHQLWQLKRILNLGLMGLLGLSPYSFLFLSQMIKLSKYSWGDLLTLHGYFVHLSRQEYGSFQLYKADDMEDGVYPNYLQKIAFYFDDLINYQYGWIGIGLALLGLMYMLHSARCRSHAFGVLGGFALYTTFFFHLCNLPLLKDKLYEGVFQRFFPQPNLVIALMIGVGAYYGYKLLKSKMPSSGGRLILIICLALLVGSQIYSNFYKMDQSDNRYFRLYAQAILDPLPNNSILLLKGDLETNSVSYLHHVEGYRPDLVLLSVNHMTYSWWYTRQQPLYPDVVFPGRVYHPYVEGGYSIGKFMLANFQKGRQIYVCYGWKVGDNSWKHPAFAITHYGLTDHVSLRYPPRTKENKTLEDYEWELRDTAWPPQVLELERNLPSPERYGPESWETRLATMYWEIMHVYATRLLDIAMEVYNKGDDFSHVYKESVNRSMLAFERLVDALKPESPSAKPSPVYKASLRNLGIAYDHMRDIMWQQNDLESGYEYARKMVRTWEKYIEYDPSDKTISDTYNSWKKYLSKL